MTATMSHAPVTGFGAVRAFASPPVQLALPGDRLARTTGTPKGIVHGHGGILLEHLKVLRMHNDVRPGDRFMLVANTSWMVWNVLVSGLLVGGTPVLLDGSATYPEPDRIWRVAAEHRVAVPGLGAGYLQLCRTTGLRPGARYDLGGLRALMSTGSP